MNWTVTLRTGPNTWAELTVEADNHATAARKATLLLDPTDGPPFPDPAGSWIAGVTPRVSEIR